MPVAAKRRPPAPAVVSLAARKKTPRSLAAGISVGDGFQLLLGAALRALRDAARGDPALPQTIHRFRVAIRRLRSLLAAFRAVLPEEERCRVGVALAALAQRYGRVREWDVLCAGTLGPLRAALPDDPAMAEIEADAAAARMQALPEDAVLGAEADAVAALLDGLRGPAAGRAAIYQSRLKDFIAALLKKHHRRLRKRLKTIDLADQPSFHRVRINAKKMRYWIEMSRNLFDAKPLESYLERAIRVQNLLGQLNDALAAPALLATLPLSAQAQGTVKGWLAREAVAARAGLPEAARRFRRAAPFWTR